MKLDLFGLFTDNKFSLLTFSVFKEFEGKSNKSVCSLPKPKYGKHGQGDKLKSQITCIVITTLTVRHVAVSR